VCACHFSPEHFPFLVLVGLVYVRRGLYRGRSLRPEKKKKELTTIIISLQPDITGDINRPGLVICIRFFPYRRNPFMGF